MDKREILLCTAGAALGFLAADDIHCVHSFVTRRYTVRSSRVSQKLTFVFVSDLHEKEFGENNEKLVHAILSAHPDAVLSGGDLIIASEAIYSGNNAFMEKPLRFLSALARKVPVFAVNGNHEDAMRIPEYNEERPGREGQHEARDRNDLYEEKLREAGVVSLHNRKLSFAGIDLWGLEPEHESYNKIFPYEMSAEDVERTIGGRPDPEKFTILLSHNPKYFAAYAGWGADLVLSGHIHGGIVRIGRQGLLSPEYRFFPKYSCGAYHRKTGNRDHTMIVSAGLGTHTVPVRLFNPAELVVVTILPDGKR